MARLYLGQHPENWIMTATIQYEKRQFTIPALLPVIEAATGKTRYAVTEFVRGYL